MYKKARILKAIRDNLNKGANLENSCKAAGVTVVTLWLWRKVKRIDNYITTILQSRVTLVEDSLFKAAIEGNITAQIFFLKNRATNRWKDRHELEHSGQLEGGINKIIIIQQNADKSIQADSKAVKSTSTLNR